MKSQKRCRAEDVTCKACRTAGNALASVDADDSSEPELDAQDGDSVPQPIEDWSDDDDANRWLHEHRFDGGKHFDIH